MGTRVLQKTGFFLNEILVTFSYFSTFSKSQLRFGARSFGARSLLYSRTCVYARACMRALRARTRSCIHTNMYTHFGVRVCAYKMVKSFSKTVHTLTKSNLLK